MPSPIKAALTLTIALALCGAALSLSAAEACAQDELSCLVKIQYEAKEAEAISLAPTVEEGLDYGLEDGCALLCADDPEEDNGAEAAAQPSSAVDEDKEAQEDPEFESCVEACVEAAETLGARCTAGETVVWTEGVYAAASEADEEDAAKDDSGEGRPC